jgi:hypothetical protein
LQARRNHFETILKPLAIEPVPRLPTLISIRLDPPIRKAQSLPRRPFQEIPAEHQPILEEITMHHIRTIAAAAIVAATAVVATSTAQAAPYHVIKYADTGFCQVWDNGFPTTPWPTHYTVMTHRQATYERAVAVKGWLLHKGYCAL